MMGEDGIWCFGEAHRVTMLIFQSRLCVGNGEQSMAECSRMEMACAIVAEETDTEKRYLAIVEERIHIISTSTNIKSIYFSPPQRHR